MKNIVGKKTKIAKYTNFEAFTTNGFDYIELYFFNSIFAANKLIKSFNN